MAGAEVSDSSKETVRFSFAPLAAGLGPDSAMRRCTGDAERGRCNVASTSFNLKMDYLKIKILTFEPTQTAEGEESKRAGVERCSV